MPNYIVIYLCKETIITSIIICVELINSKNKHTLINKNIILFIIFSFFLINIQKLTRILIIYKNTL